MHEEERRPDVSRKQVVKIFYGVFLDRRSFTDAGVGNQNVELFTRDSPDLFGEVGRAIRGSEIGRY